MMFAYVTSYIDRVNIGFAQLHMAQELGFSNTVYGLGAGIFFVGYVFFEVPSNILLARVGARLWFVRILVSWGLISGLMSLISSPTQFYVMRFLLGVAEAGFIPGLVYYIGCFYPADRRGRVISMFYVALALAGLLGGPLSGWILHSMEGVLGLSAWKWLFIIEAIPAGLAAILVFKVMPDDPSRASFLTAQQRSRLNTLMTLDRQTKATVPFWTILRNKYIWIMSLIFFADVVALYGISFWTPMLVKQMGAANDLAIGLISAIPSACAAVTMVFFGRSADRLRERRWHLVALFALAIVGLLLGVLWQNNLILGVLALSLATMGLISVPPLFWSLPTAVLSIGAAAAAGIAFISAFGNLAGFVAPYLIGAVKDATGSTDLAMYLLVGCLVVGALLTLSIPKHLVNR